MDRTSRTRLPLLLVLPAVAGLGACTPADVVAPPGAAAAELTAFDDCEELLGYYKQHALDRVGPWGFTSGPGYGVDTAAAGAAEDGVGAVPSAAASAEAGRDYSGTNNQVEGVEEPDVVQTDGKIVVTVRGGRVVVVDVASASTVGSVDLPLRGDGGDSQLLLDRAAGRALVLTTEWTGGGHPMPVDDTAERTAYPAFPVERTVVTTVDLSDPAAPRVLGAVRLEGSYRSARMHDGAARVVLVSQPAGLTFTYPGSSSLRAEKDAEQANREIIESSTIDDWLPHLERIDEGRAADIDLAVGCGDVARPADFSGLATMSVLTFDVGGDGVRPTSSSGLVASGSTVYASEDRLVVATSQADAWAELAEPGIVDRIWPRHVSTALHTFDIGEAGRTSHVASGRVQGHVLNQFAIDETDGVIRVATTKESTSSAPSSSSLVVLAEEGRELVERGRVDGMGLTEQIRSVRYLSPDLAAVVTFRQTDPLYLVDTSDPGAPRVAGELKIPGYSAYLHPVGEGRLLGIGQDATEDGRTTGLQVSLFDVSDPSSPARLSQTSMKDTSSGAEWDHHAVTWWGPTGQLFLPAQRWGGDTSWAGVVSTTVGPRTVEAGPELTLSSSSTGTWESPRRTLVIGDQLWVLGDSAFRVADLATLEETTTIPL